MLNQTFDNKTNSLLRLYLFSVPRETDKQLFVVFIPNYFSGIPNCFSNERYHNA